MLRSPITSSDIVFLGDSLTEAFDLRHYFKDTPVKNRGLSGDTTYQVLYRMEEVLRAKPKKLFLMVGINDLFNGEDEVIIFQNIASIIESFIQQSPATELFVQSILPVNESVILSDENINLLIFSLNEDLMRYCKKLTIRFLDLYGHFLDSQGEMDRKYTYDGVHLTPEGYKLWAELILPRV